MADTTYEKAWHEDEEGGEPLVDAVNKAKKESREQVESEYAKAYRELEDDRDDDAEDGVTEKRDGKTADDKDDEE